MYQFVVLAVGFTLLFSIGYYINKTEGHKIIYDAFTKTTPVKNEIATAESIVGIYACSESSGCINRRTMTLTPSGGVNMITVFGNGEETLSEEGSWKLEDNGFLTVSLIRSSQGEYDIPHILSIKSPKILSLGDIIYDTKSFPDMSSPSFVKE